MPAPAVRDPAPSRRSTMKLALLAAVAYIWALGDDAPVNLDALLNGYPGGHYFLEALFKVLTLAFALLAIREAAKGSSPSTARWVLLGALAALALTLANLDDLALAVRPLHFMRQEELWDPANALTKAASLGVFWAAVRAAGRGGRAGPARPA